MRRLFGLPITTQYTLSGNIYLLIYNFSSMFGLESHFFNIYGPCFKQPKRPSIIEPQIHFLIIPRDQKQKEKKIPNLLWSCKSWHNERGKQRGSWFCSATEVRDWWHPRRRLVQGRSSELRQAYLCNKLQLFSALAVSYKVQSVEIITIRSVMGSVSYLNHIIIPYPYLLCAFFFFFLNVFGF